jgi:hypothetical protein
MALVDGTLQQRVGSGAVSAKLTTAIAALGGVVAVAGCEAVAGIRDLTYSAPAGAVGTVTPDGDATVEGSANDASETPDASVDAPASTPDATGYRDAADTAEALSEAANGVTGETGVEGGVGDAGTDVAEGGSGVGASDAEAVSYTVPIPGADGGLLKGTDGGALTGELVDDIDSEFNAGWILPRSGRVGTWFTYDDGTAGGVMPTQAQSTSMPSLIVGMLTGPDGQPSNLAAHVTGSGAASYAGAGFNLNGGAPSSYDATGYRGFVFSGRLGGDSGSVSLKFAVPDRNTSAAGGVCPTDAGTGCGDYFAKSITFTPDWQQFVIYYSQLGQVGFGLPKGLNGLDAAHIYSCQFQPAIGAAFDLWIDDVYFIDQ